LLCHFGFTYSKAKVPADITVAIPVTRNDAFDSTTILDIRYPKAPNDSQALGGLSGVNPVKLAAAPWCWKKPLRRGASKGFSIMFNRQSPASGGINH
jgi:hypothetical protein